MKKLFVVLLVSAFFITACGPSAEDAEAQRIKDSIQLEEDRVKILEKANELLVPDSLSTENKDEKEEDDSGC
ncbi:MAG: hypothetical protein KGZ97_07470 [Bacteroidetes bacterium]|nr:hypothetical protein [Bacteroidota bacterium]